MHIIKKKALFFILSAIAAILSAIAARTLPEPDNINDTQPSVVRITFADVDQGNATLITTPNGETILIDGGEYDTYESHLLPFLEEQSINKIDYAIVTHYHSDHMGGIQNLTKDNKISRLFLPDYKDNDKSKSLLVKDANKHKIPISYLSSGNTVKTQTDELAIKVLHPPKGGNWGDNFHNNSSLVLSITYGGDTFLLTGDIEARTEKELIESSRVSCDVLQVAHHGSSTSSSKKFILSADPTYAIISAGADNRYGHPHNEVLELLENEDIRTYRTDIDGNITFEVTSKGIEKISFSKT